MLDYKQYRALKALAQTKGWLTRWRLTRQALDHMPAVDRQEILYKMRVAGLIQQRRTRPPTGAGAPSEQYRITPAGLSVYKKTEAQLKNGEVLPVASTNVSVQSVAR